MSVEIMIFIAEKFNETLAVVIWILHHEIFISIRLACVFIMFSVYLFFSTLK